MVATGVVKLGRPTPDSTKGMAKDGIGNCIVGNCARTSPNRMVRRVLDPEDVLVSLRHVHVLVRQCKHVERVKTCDMLPEKAIRDAVLLEDHPLVHANLTFGQETMTTGMMTKGIIAN